MAYARFSTGNADYVLQVGLHSSKLGLPVKARTDVFEGCDAVVLETGGMGGLRRLLTEGHQQMGPVIDFAHERRVPLYSVDVAPQYRGARRLMVPMERLAMAPSLPYVLWAGASQGEADISPVYSAFTFALQGPLNEVRDAINAEKIESVIAPMMQGKLGRKPIIGLLYGAEHFSIQPNLQSARRRKFTLWNWRNFNYPKWDPFDVAEMNRFWKAVPIQPWWDIYSFDTHDFGYTETSRASVPVSPP